jgi:hypothetical protein
LTVTGWTLLAALHTGLVETHTQMLVDAMVRLLKADVQIVLGVVAALGALMLRGSLEASAKHLGEYVRHSSRKRISLRGPVGVTELVKVLALLLV